MIRAKIKICCFGEILWDVFPNKKLLGGAPLNVALRLHKLGADVTMISAVGSDALGGDALEIIQDYGLNTASIQKHQSLPTGAVHVALTEGIASYTFEAPSAWDAIQLDTKVLVSLPKQDAFVFGSLALRHEANRNVLEAFLKKAPFSVFDVNLRPPYVSKDLVLSLLPKANLIKMNEEELAEISTWLGISASEGETQIRALSQHTGVPAICVTRGEHGAVLYNAGRFYHHSGFRVTVADTVGAGDSFLAGLLYGMLQGNSSEESLRLASALGALVASKEGANGEVTSEELRNILAS